MFKKSWMKKIYWAVFFLIMAFLTLGTQVQAQNERYSEILCGDTINYTCLTVGTKEIEKTVKTKQGEKVVTKEIPQTWEDLFPNETQREIIQKINRLNTKLGKDSQIAVPKNLAEKTLLDFSPFPLTIEPIGEKKLIWDPQLLAFAAYDETGMLVHWGAAVGGKDYCPDVKSKCHTVTGDFQIISKKGAKHRSSKFPIGCGCQDPPECTKITPCAPMPYAMYFASSYAFHGGVVPGRHDSHGCVRLFLEDAKWLNEELAEIGTKVTILPYEKKPASEIAKQ